MKIIDSSGKPVKAAFEMEYQGYKLTFDTTTDIHVVIVNDGCGAFGWFYGPSGLTDAMAFVNRGCVRLAA